MMRSDHLYPDRLHFTRLRVSWPGWFPGRSEIEVREALFGETERLREWYGSMLKRDPPYQAAARGYVAAYMPRGYFWLGTVVGRHARLRKVVTAARSVLVVGCGPAPEFWSLSQHLCPEATVTLVDAEMDVWKPFIQDFTVPLVGEARGLVNLAAELPFLDFRHGAHGSIKGRFDLIVAQQVLNEIAVRPVSRHQGPLTALSTVSAWRQSLRQGGAIVVVDNDNKDRRLRGIEDDLPRGACEPGSLKLGVVRCAQDLKDWLSGPWGQFVPRKKAPTKYLVIYSDVSRGCCVGGGGRRRGGVLRCE